MKFLEVLCVGFDFHPSLVVARSLRAFDTLDHLGFDWLFYESDRLVKSSLVEESILFFSFAKLRKSCVQILDFIFRKENNS